MPICIYCLENKTADNFNTEHVLPVSFGTFKNSFTLIETVCAECNQYFADKLELALGRDSMEGLLRYLHGIKDAKNFKFFKEHRIRFRLAEKGIWEGAILEMAYSKDKNKLVANHINQVGFKKENADKWVYFAIEKIPSKEDLKKQGFRIEGPRSLKTLFSHCSNHNEIEKQIEAKGFKLSKDPGDQIHFSFNEIIKTSMHGIIDKAIYRCIAKIAFNYLTSIMGRGFVLNDNFDGIRNFIRYDKENDFKYVLLQKKPILFYERKYGTKETSGHIITIDWTSDKRTLISQVALFNYFTYRIIFCKYFEGIYRDIARGHHFDIESKEISALGHLPFQPY